MYRIVKVDYNDCVKDYLKSFISLHMSIGSVLSFDSFNRENVEIYSISSSSLSEFDLYEFKKGWQDRERGDLIQLLYEFIHDDGQSYSLYSEDFNLCDKSKDLDKFKVSKFGNNYIHVLRNERVSPLSFEKFYKDANTFHFSILKSHYSVSDEKNEISRSDLDSIVESMSTYICSAYDDQGFLVFKLNA